MSERLTAARTRDLLDRYGLRARRSLGQHFLVDPNTISKIVRLSGVGPDDTVLEIGPGLGSLTVELARHVREVVAVELDPAVATALEETVGAPNVRVIVADALRADLSSLVPKGARLVANLPYNVATPILLRILEDVPQVGRGFVMVQRELGERWTASPGSRAYGAVTVKVQFHATAQVAGTVSRRVFMPPPAVESVLVRFARRQEPPVDVDDARRFLDFVSRVFTHRRKTLTNAVSAAGYERGPVEAALGRAGIDSRARPGDLDISRWATLYRCIGPTGEGA